MCRAIFTRVYTNCSNTRVHICIYIRYLRNICTSTLCSLAAADGCIGGYNHLSGCLDEYEPAYPCAFANVDLNGIPLTLVNDFGYIGLGPASTIVFSADNKTANLWGGE